jgi:Asp-tRNA(Asn)/Glu-tRNA(Gln) amidotransferase A subunit family amidase
LLYTIFLKNEVFQNLVLGKIGLKEELETPMVRMKELLKMSTPKIRELGEKHKGSPRDSLIYRSLVMGREYNYGSLKKRQIELTDTVIQRFKTAGVEVVICPGLFPAFKLDTSADCDLICSYLYQWNLLNFPAGAMPVTRVRSDEQVYEPSCSDLFTKCVQDSMKGSEGLPIGIQVVGLPWKEELVVKTMKTIYGLLKNKN